MRWMQTQAYARLPARFPKGSSNEYPLQDQLLNLLLYWRDGWPPKTHGNILQLPKCTVTQANIGAHTGAETAACYAYWLQPPFFQRGCQAWSSYVSHVRLHGEGLPRPPFHVEGSMIAYELHNPTHIPSPFMHEPIHITI